MGTYIGTYGKRILVVVAAAVVVVVIAHPSSEWKFSTSNERECVHM